MSGAYDEAMFFMVDFGISIAPIAIATLKIFDVESFAANFDTDYSSDVSHILFIGYDTADTDFGARTNGDGGYAVVHARLDTS